MAAPRPVVVRSLHHGAVPVANVARSQGFYGPLFGARLSGLVNATVSALQHGYPETALFEMAGCDAFGLALQIDAIPAPRGIVDGAAWGIETDREQVERLTQELARRNRPTAAPTPLPAACPFEHTLAFQDPDGNSWELCVPRQQSAPAASVPLTLRYASLEATDLAQAEDFYSGLLGLECEAREPDLLAFSACAGGRWLLVRKVAEMSPRTALVQGPHIAFEVNAATFDARFASLPRREQYWERETNRVPWTEPWQRVGYVYDPFYNRLALVVP